MGLELKYEKAADMKISNPEMEWAAIADHIGVSERQLRRVRASADWQEYWNSQDKQTMIDHLRKAAITSQNASLYREYFAVTGQLDESAQEALLKMGDEEFKKEVAYISEYHRAKQAESSQGTDAVSA